MAVCLGNVGLLKRRIGFGLKSPVQPVDGTCGSCPFGPPTSFHQSPGRGLPKHRPAFLAMSVPPNSAVPAAGPLAPPTQVAATVLGVLATGDLPVRNERACQPGPSARAGVQEPSASRRDHAGPRSPRAGSATDWIVHRKQETKPWKGLKDRAYAARSLTSSIDQRSNAAAPEPRCALSRRLTSLPASHLCALHP